MPGVKNNVGTNNERILSVRSGGSLYPGDAMIAPGLTKPCPFCNSENHDVKTVVYAIQSIGAFNDLDESPPHHVVACLQCGAQGPAVIQSMNQSEEAAMQSAIEGWNAGLYLTAEEPAPVERTVEYPPVGMVENWETGLVEHVRPTIKVTMDPSDAAWNQRETHPEPEEVIEEVEEEEATRFEAAAEQDCIMAMRQWMELEDKSCDAAGEVVGVSGQTIKNILNGNNPRKRTLELIEAAFSNYPPEVNFVPNDDPEVIGNLPQQPTPKEAAAYLQRTLANWMRNQGLDHSAAAMDLQVKKVKLLQILQLKLPLAPDIERICKRIPELKPDLKPLLAARKMLDNQKKVA